MKETILIADTDTVSADAIKAILHKAGYNLTDVHSAGDAIEMLWSPFDMLIIENSFTPSECDQIVRAARKYPKTVVLLLSSEKSEKDMLRLGADGFIDRPVNQIQLCETVKKCLNKKRDLFQEDRDKFCMLMLDDNEDLLNEMNTFFKDLFYIDVSNSVTHALQMIKKKPYNIIISNIMSIEMDGMFFINAAINIRPKAFIIIITDVTSKELTAKGVKKDLFEFLEKPLHPKDLLFAIHKACKELLVEQKKNRHNIMSDLKNVHDSFLNIVNSQTDGIMVIDSNGIIIYANPAVETLFRAKQSAFIGQLFGFPLGNHNEDRTEIGIFRSNGEKGTAEIITTNIFWHGKKSQLITFRDITDRKRTQKQVQRQTLLLEGINSIFEKTLTCDTEEELILTCLKICKELTISNYCWITELNEKGFLDILCFSDRNHECLNPAKEIETFIKNMSANSMNVSIIKEGKAQIINDFESYPESKVLHDVNTFLLVPMKESGKIFGIIGLANKEFGYLQTNKEDIEILSSIILETIKRKRAEKKLSERALELEQSNKEIKQKNEELDDFAFIASHDLKEPLRKVRSFSKLLIKDIGDHLSVNAQKDIDYIMDASSRMQSLIDNLLNLSRVGRASMSHEKISLNICVSYVIDMMSPQIKDKNATIHIHDLPEITGDKTMITQLYQNLIGNALKFVHNKAPIIHLTSEIVNENQVLGVKDNGIGIDSKYIDMIFSPFKRLHSRETFEGTGIGLSICQKIVKRHNGSIWVESKEGEGSHFRFTLSTYFDDSEKRI